MTALSNLKCEERKSLTNNGHLFSGINVRKAFLHSFLFEIL